MNCEKIQTNSTAYFIQKIHRLMCCLPVLLHIASNSTEYSSLKKNYHRKITGNGEVKKALAFK